SDVRTSMVRVWPCKRQHARTNRGSQAGAATNGSRTLSAGREIMSGMNEQHKGYDHFDDGLRAARDGDVLKSHTRWKWKKKEYAGTRRLCSALRRNTTGLNGYARHSDGTRRDPTAKNSGPGAFTGQWLAPTQATVVAQFRNYHAEKFSGQGDPRIVDEWIQGLEFIFEVMECPDRYRVVCAQLHLTGDARLWWNAYWSMRPGEKAGCTWEMFKDLVREKYYPSYYRAEMERQFLALQQGTRTVDEYEREFTRLAAFVPDLVRTEAQRAQRFIDGLFPAVRHNIVGHETQTYARA
ncbi:Unknown protein, partial [Striga hermonthica]